MNFELFDLCSTTEAKHSAYLGALLGSISMLIELYKKGELPIDEFIERLETYTNNIEREVLGD